MIDERALARRDFDTCESPRATVLVLGYPYRQGPCWVRARDLLSEYEATGTISPERIHGFFVLLVRDRLSGRSLIVTDRFRGYDVYVTRAGGRLIISDSVESIAQAVPALHLDHEAVLEFLYFGFIFGDKTHFLEVRKVPCATMLTVEPGSGPHEHAYWSCALGRDHGDAVEAGTVAEMFMEHMGDCFELSPGAALTLTGGRDSRSVLAACLDHKEDLRCFTFGHVKSRDVRFAKRICSSAGIRHRSYMIEDELAGDLPGHAEAVASRSSGMVNSILFSNLDPAYQTEGDDGGILITGIATDLHRGYWLRGKGKVILDQSEVIGHGMQAVRTNRMPGLISGMDDRSVNRSLLDSVNKALEGLDMPEPSRSEYFLFRERASNFSTYFVSEAGRFMDLWDTWLYAPLIDVLGRVDLQTRTEERILWDLIQAAGGAIANTISTHGFWFRSGPPSPRQAIDSALIHSANFSRKALNRLGRATVKREPVKANYTIDYVELLAGRYPEFIESTLQHEDMALGGLIDRDALRRNVALLMRGYSSVCYGITNVMCLELWLKRIGESTRVVID
jgi:Asparagine synthase